MTGDGTSEAASPPPLSLQGVMVCLSQRDVDVSGVSGTGVVAEGVEFSSGVVALTWLSDWPTSVVFHDRGMASVEAIHGHAGSTRIVYLDTASSAAEGDEVSS